MSAALVNLEPGMRVVIRYRLDDGRATDALGILLSLTSSHAVVDTKRGAESIELVRVIASKVVPPPPRPRP
ncbi:MAG TPA: hypothetical protein PKY48_06755 [Rhodoglobus sp.]|nr:hypothetical protein [Rhodoglobus sp.]HOW01089.1 hypothetical protein [Rhodoglobus sp.]HQA23356.1 hypothetical protein [Rhodoglobus sp.]HQE46850.1 hypothetical protein [Rhodoglobus sp.]HQG70794.1 hypothetical protein [Rhodoglobus sp.]